MSPKEFDTQVARLDADISRHTKRGGILAALGAVCTGITISAYEYVHDPAVVSVLGLVATGLWAGALYDMHRRFAIVSERNSFVRDNVVNITEQVIAQRVRDVSGRFPPQNTFEERIADESKPKSPNNN